MPRTSRYIVDNSIYHVLNRGHNQNWLFNKPGDYNTFKDIIRKYKEKFPVELYHYCLMPNHFHLLLRIDRAGDFPLLMKGICQSYANYFRRTYSHRGYLFQNRYKSIYIDRDAYLLECARYIERNPHRANLVKDLSEFPWSSYNYYAKGRPDDILDIDPLYELLGRTPKERMRSYIEYVAKPRPYELLLDEKIATLS